jgi:hypothetical protein
MRTREMVKLTGNFNRLKELVEVGVSDETISCHFRSYGVNIEPADVPVLYRCGEMMKTASVAKRATKALVNDQLQYG